MGKEGELVVTRSNRWNSGREGVQDNRQANNLKHLKEKASFYKQG